MTPMVVLIVAAFTLALLLFMRFGYLPFLRDLDNLDGMIKYFAIVSPENRNKVRNIGRAFFTGYNAMLRHKDPLEIRQAAESLPPFFRPFCYEGAAMGFSLKAFLSFFKYSRADFERLMRATNEDYIFLYFIGLGFWYGFRYPFRPKKVERLISSIRRPEFKYLVIDGYGFKNGFFDYAKNPKVLYKGLRFQGYAQHAYYQGFGRALWFVFMDTPEMIFQHIAKLNEAYHNDCYAGLGLAVAFTNINNLKFAFDFADRIADRYRPHFYLGISIAVYTRHVNDKNYVEEQLRSLDGSYAAWVRQAIEANQAAYGKTVSQPEHDAGYEQWRDDVLRFLAIHNA